MPDKFDWRSTLKEVVEEKSRQLGPHPIHDEMAAYHAGELGEEEAKALQDHLVLCPQCARLLLDLDAFAIDAASPGANQAHSQHRGLRWRHWQLPAAFAAAILLLALAWPEPLPHYDAMRLSEGVLPTRTSDSGPDEGPSVFVPGRRLFLRIEPDTAPESPPTARAYLRHAGELRALSASTLQVESNGVVSLQGIVGTDLLMPPGESDLIVSVARPWMLPSRADLAKGDSSSGWGWTALRRKIQISAPADSAPQAERDDRWVVYSGCRKVMIGPICILGNNRRLTLWVRHRQEDEIRIHAGGWSSWRRSYHRTPVGEGFRYQIEVGRTRQVVVEVLQEETRLIWALEVAYKPAPEWLAKAQRLRDEGEPDEARRLLRTRISAQESAEVAAALSLLARIERSSGQAALGDDYYRRAIAAHHEAGNLSEEIHHAAGLSFYLIEEHRFSELRQLLDPLPVAATGGYAESLYYMAYTRGLLAKATGDLREALRWMDLAARFAERAGMIREQLFADDNLALQLGTAGLMEQAAALYSEMQPQVDRQCESQDEPSELNPCDCARLAVNRAWVGLLAVEAGRPVDGDPSILLDQLDQAERIFAEEARRKGSCVWPDDLPNVRLNLALAALHSGNPAEASLHLDRAGVDPEEFPRLELWRLDIQARIRLDDNQPELALDLYDELESRAMLSLSPEAQWRATFGRATALESLQEDGKAIQACLQAERLLDQESFLVPMHQGRERFIAQREQAARFCLDLLLRANRHEEALAAAARSAARALSSLRADARIADLASDVRRQWEQAVNVYEDMRSEVEALAGQIWKGQPGDKMARLQEEIQVKRQALLSLHDQIASLPGSSGPSGRSLALPSGNALLLAYHPLPEGWAALAADKNGVLVERIQEPFPEDGEGSPEDLSSRLLKPFAERIDQAAEIRVIAYGGLRNLDFHALPYGDGILLDRAPVAYHLDLPAPSAEASPSWLALVVAGPGLFEAVTEASAVQDALKSPSSRWNVELLEYPAAAEVRRRLAHATLFHYAGHAEYDEHSRGWESHLALSGGTRLTVDDILNSPRVPRWVVLSGCETSRDSQTAPLPSIGLAQAFLVAGAEAVLAATAEVSDAEAAELMEAFYRHWDSSTPMATALQKAQLDLMGTIRDWKKFRILAR